MMSAAYNHDVRTTLTLEEDVAARLKREARRTGKSFKQVVNETLRLGLAAPRRLRPASPFRVRARALGIFPGRDYDDVGALLEELEGPAHP